MMDIYTLFMICVVLGHLLLIKNRKSLSYGDSKKLFCAIMGMLLFLIAALRSTSVGFDSGQYSRHFYELQRISFLDAANISINESGFYILAKLLTYISANHQILFAVVGAIFAYSVSRFIYRYSMDAMVSFIMLITMSYFGFSLTGLRQTVALSLLLLSMDYVFQRRFFHFIFIVLVASYFHNSALFFVPVYFLPKKPVTNNQLLVLFLVVPIIYLLRYSLISLVQVFLYSEYSILSIGSTSGGWSTLIVYILIVSVAVFYRKSIYKRDHNFSVFFFMMYLGMCLQMFVPIQPNIFRVSMYYDIAGIILIPGILKSETNPTIRAMVYTFFIILMAIRYYIFDYYSAGMNPYSFFW